MVSCDLSGLCHELSFLLKEIKRFIHDFSYFIKSLFRKRKTISYAVLALIIAIAVVFYKVGGVNALSRAFTQTDWSGGADEAATANDTNLLNWTKYYSKTSTVDASTSGEIKLNMTVSP